MPKPHYLSDDHVNLPLAKGQRSNMYFVMVDGRSVFVERFEDIHIAHVTFSDACDVTVSTRPTIGEENRRYVYQYSIRPLRANIASKSSRGNVTFRLEKSVKLMIQINEYERLFLIADRVPDAALARPQGANVIDIMDYVNDNAGQILQTQNIARAIAATPRDGILYFPPGTYLTGSIHLKSDMTLHVAKGAVIQGTSDPNDYPATQSTHWMKRAMLHIAGAKNVTVTGFGVFDSSGALLREQKAGPHLMVIHGCSDCTVENVTLRDSAAWNTHVINSRNITLRNIKVLTNRDVLNTDGVDLESCQNSVLEDCLIYSGDDGACVKSNAEMEVRDLIIRRNLVVSLKSALKIGSETFGHCTNVVFIDNDVVECDRGMSLYVEDGATVKDTQYVNNRFELSRRDTRMRLIDFYIWNRNGGGRIENVLIKDCAVENKWPRPSTINAASGPVLGVRFENFTIAGQVAHNMREADLLIEVLPCNDARNPGVRDLSFTPADTNNQGWNPGLV